MAPTQFRLSKGNRELAQDGIFVWSIPAFAVRSEIEGRLVKTCPSAGVCAALCYARSGTYRFSNVVRAHTRNLDDYLEDREGWVDSLIAELEHKRYRPTGRPHVFRWEVRDGFEWWAESGGRSVSIHDAGDFFDEAYLAHWLEVATSAPDVLFYAYTKEVAAYRRAEAAGLVPKNFVVIFSLGGRQDHLVDRDRDRHDDIFPTLEALIDAGYVDQAESDLMAALLPEIRIGIVSNNIPQLKKRQGAASFSELQRGERGRSIDTSPSLVHD
jgi:hypothetical protein